MVKGINYKKKDPTIKNQKSIELGHKSRYISSLKAIYKPSKNVSKSKLAYWTKIMVPL